MNVPVACDFYDDPELYEASAISRGEVSSFYLHRAQQLGGPVLELGCGTARILTDMAQVGFEVHGVDFHPQMIERAQKKAQRSRAQAQFTEADLRSVHLDRKFRLIFMAENLLNQFYDRLSIERALSGVRRHLEFNGEFVFDVFHPRPNVLDTQGQRDWLCDFTYSHKQEIVRLEVQRTYHCSSQIRESWYYYSTESQKDFRVRRLDERCFFPKELEAILHYNGFQLVEKLGSFHGDTFQSDHDHQIIVARVQATA